MHNYSDQGGRQGGFLSSPSDSPSADSPSKAKGRSTGSHSLTPVTIKQLGQAVQLGDAFKVDGVELNMITIVGAIVRESQTTTNRNYEVDDGTGVIQVRIWIESDDSSDHIARQLSSVGVGKYVRVVGQLSQLVNSERSMVAFRIIPITDFNEVTFHHLEVIQVHLSRTRSHVANQGERMLVGTHPKEAISLTFSVASLPYYVSTKALKRECQFNRDILAALDFLMGEGHIYTGIDDMHVMASQRD